MARVYGIAHTLSAMKPLWMCALLAVAACGKKSDDKPAAAPVDAAVAKPVRLLTMESATAGQKLVVTTLHPAGWSQTVDGGLTVFTDPTPALAFPSTLAFGEGCLAPPCGAGEEDMDKAAQSLVDGFKKGGATDVKMTKVAATDGATIDLDVVRDSGPVHVHARAVFQSGWPAEATCVAVAADTLLAHQAELAASCDKMTVSVR